MGLVTCRSGIIFAILARIVLLPLVRQAAFRGGVSAELQPHLKLLVYDS